MDYAYKDYPAIIRRAGLNHLDPLPEPEPDPDPDPNPDPDCQQIKEQLKKTREALAQIEKIASQALEE